MVFSDRTPKTGCRRKATDRRVSVTVATFPLIDSDNIRLAYDRRRIPDRRMNNFIVTYEVRF